MAYYVTRENDLTGAGTAWTTLSQLGGETRNAIIVPPGCSSIRRIISAFGSSVVTTAKGFIAAGRLRGSGMMGADYQFLAGGMTNGAITGNDTRCWYVKSTILDTNLAVAPGGEIWIDGSEITGADSGTPFLAVTLVFDSGGGARRNSYVRVHEAVEAVDTRYIATLDSIHTTVNAITWPMSAKRITNLVTCQGGIAVAAGTAGGGTALLRLEGGLLDGDMVFAGGGWGTEIDTVGTSAAMFSPDTIPTDIAVVAGGVTNVICEVTGVDWGTWYSGIQVEVE